MTETISARLREAIERHAAEGLTAIVGAHGPVSYAALGALIDGFAAGVRDWHVARGTMIGFLAPKSVDAIAAYFGAMQAGACVCFIDPALAPDIVAAQMDAVGMSHLVLDETLRTRFDGSAMVGKNLRSLATLRTTDSYADSGAGSGDKAMLLFTSGSTGLPKGVVLRHESLVCNAEGVLRHTATTTADRLLHVMPLYHTNGVNNQLIVPLLAGASIILVEQFRAEDTIDRLRRDAPTYMTGVPTMYARMLPHLAPGERFPSLRFLRCGSAPITPALHQQIEDAFGVPLIVSYGLSEATCTSTMNPPTGRRIGTIGTVLAGQDVRLFDPAADIEVPAGAEGEIRISGPALMSGYIGAGVGQPIIDGWLRTGDLGRFDPDGFLAITGRLKDVIIRGGENISPALIERQLAAHPTIRDCCVVGAPHADLGEVPIAFVVLKGDTTFDEDGIKDHVRRSLARMYVPAHIRPLDALPVNRVGKVDRKALREMLATNEAVAGASALTGPPPSPARGPSGLQ